MSTTYIPQILQNLVFIMKKKSLKNRWYNNQVNSRLIKSSTPGNKQFWPNILFLILTSLYKGLQCPENDKYYLVFTYWWHSKYFQVFQYRFIIPFSIFVKRHCAYKRSLNRNIWEDWVICPCIRWYINTYKITELSLAKIKIFYHNNCGGINYWRKISIGKIFCWQIWPLHPNFSFCIPDGCVNPITYIS